MEKFKGLLGGALIVFGIAAFNMPHIQTADALQGKPATTTSWYVKVTADETDQDLLKWMYQAGYEAGKQDFNAPGAQHGLAVLDFGQPWQMDGVQGVWTFSAVNGRFLSNATILAGLEKFAWGYYYGTGKDVYSTLKVAVGTNNYGTNVTYEHGKEWAKLTNDFGAWLKANKPGSQVAARGANDMEPDFGDATTTRAWLSGYTSSWKAPYYLYNYGAATGCSSKATTTVAVSATSTDPNSTSSTGVASSSPNCLNGWTQDDVQYVSWGAAPSWAFPEIYANSGVNARQWQQISLRSSTVQNSKITYLGAMTQTQACTQRGGCTGISNTPEEAWTQFWTALSSDSRTAQNLLYSTDIKWRK